LRKLLLIFKYLFTHNTLRTLSETAGLLDEKKLYFKRMISLLRKAIDYIIESMISAETLKVDDTIQKYILDYIKGDTNIIEDINVENLGAILLAAVYFDGSIKFEIEEATRMNTFDYLMKKAWYNQIYKSKVDATIEQKKIAGSLN
jgi:hypothetical protein